MNTLPKSGTPYGVTQPPTRRAKVTHVRTPAPPAYEEPPFTFHDFDTLRLPEPRESHHLRGDGVPYPAPFATLVMARVTIRGWYTDRHFRRTPHALANIGMADALSECFRVLRETAPDAALAVLLHAAHPTHGAPLEPINVKSWSVNASREGWATTRLDHPDGTGESLVIFESRQARDAAPRWVWHSLAADFLLKAIPRAMTGTPPG